MSYEITVQDEAEKAKLLAFVATLRSAYIIEKPPLQEDEEDSDGIIPAERPLAEGEVPPYFGMCPDWPDLKEQREAEYHRRIGQWL